MHTTIRANASVNHSSTCPSCPQLPRRANGEPPAIAAGRLSPLLPARSGCAKVVDVNQSTPRELIGRLHDWADQDVWQEFFGRYKDLIYGLAVRSGLSSFEANDVVQETLLTVAKAVANFDTAKDRGAFKAWLLTTTRWRIADQFRKRLPVKRTGTTSTDHACSRDDTGLAHADEQSESHWKQQLLELALERIKSRIRPSRFQMFQLHVIKDLPARRVARTLGVKLGQVYFAKYTITAMLKREIRSLERLPL